MRPKLTAAPPISAPARPRNRQGQAAARCGRHDKADVLFLDRPRRRFAPGEMGFQGSSCTATILEHLRSMSALPPIADIVEHDRHVRFVPKADMQQRRRYSITWSASNCIEDGTLRPNALAVFILMTSSNLVGCSTGRSAGFAPFSILSTNEAARRNKSEMSVP